MPTITISTPGKSIVSDNGTAQTKQKESGSEFNKLVLANTTLVVWLIFLAIGGGILALYYARIGYLPDMEWNAVIIYLFIGTLVGGAIGLLLTISLFVPGFIWSEFIICDPSVNFSYMAPGNELAGKKPNRELCIFSMIQYLGLPFIAAVLLSHTALLVGKITYWIFAVIILALVFLFIWIRFRDLLKKHAAPGGVSCTGGDTVVNRQLFKYSFWFTLSVFLCQISTYVLYWFSGRPGELSLIHNGPGGISWHSWMNDHLPIFIILTLMCAIGQWGANQVIALLYRDHPGQAIVTALLVAGLLLFTADRFSSLSVRLLGTYGFGGESRITLVMNKDGAGIVYNLGLTASPETVTLQNVEILSKVGDHYFFSIDHKTFTLPKSGVVSMQSVDRRRKK
ncbi:MAG TPA: hypothetical protein VJT15_09905 [Pyrinomonadaceae bacterium]|nr:hypothetical protein [Pyrinomonadaceae bacterium]